MSTFNKNIGVIIVVIAAGFLFKSFWAALITYGLIVLLQAFIDSSSTDKNNKQ